MATRKFEPDGSLKRATARRCRSSRFEVPGPRTRQPSASSGSRAVAAAQGALGIEAGGDGPWPGLSIDHRARRVGVAVAVVGAGGQERRPRAGRRSPGPSAGPGGWRGRRGPRRATTMRGLAVADQDARAGPARLPPRARAGRSPGPAPPPPASVSTPGAPPRRPPPAPAPGPAPAPARGRRRAGSRPDRAAGRRAWASRADPRRRRGPGAPGRREPLRARGDRGSRAPRRRWWGRARTGPRRWWPGRCRPRPRAPAPAWAPARRPRAARP